MNHDSVQGTPINYNHFSSVDQTSQLSPAKFAIAMAQKYSLSIIPLARDKRPPMAWKPFQERAASLSELEKWHTRYNPEAWGIVTGSVSKVLVLDFDGAAGKETLTRLGLTPHVQTGSGGGHTYFQHPGWKVQTLNSKSKVEMGKRWPGLDIRADGGYAAFCGQNEKGPYIWLREFEPDKLEILPDELRRYLGLLQSPEDAAQAREQAKAERALAHRLDFIRWALDRIGQGGRGRNDTAFDLACQLRDNRIGETDAQSIMREFVSQVSTFNQHGNYEPFTDREALNALEQAYKEPARQPWSVGAARTASEVDQIDQRINQVLTNLPATKSTGQHLPEIVIGGQLRDQTSIALEALRMAEQKERTLFVQSARLVQIATTEEDRPMLLHVGIPEMRNRLTQAANFFREKRKNDEEVILIPISPPKDLAESILALNPAKWPFPALEAIIEAPAVRADGSILDTPGYDSATHLYYAPEKGMEHCKVSCNPTPEQCAAALALIQEIFADFPYVSNADRSNVIGLLFTPFLRPAFKGHIPLALLNAPKPGSGKGLQAEAISVVVTGDTCPILTPPDSEEEWQKSITAELLQGPSLICIDNVPGLLKSTKLEGVITAKKHKGRILGLSKLVTPHNKATWMATGNNIRVGGDLGRRCYRITIDPQTSQPWRLTGFLHENLIEWVTENRVTIVSAVLTLIRAWYVAGKPIDENVPKLGSFNVWARMVGSVLAYAGIEDFLGNLDELQSEVDQESIQWERFLRDWFAIYGDKEITTGMLERDILAGIAKENEVAGVSKSFSENGPDLAGVCESFSLESLPEYLATCLKEKPASFSLKLAHQLGKRVDACFGKENYCIRRREDSHLKKPVWRVVAGVAGVSREKTDPTRTRKNSLISSNHAKKTKVASDAELPVEPPQPPQNGKALATEVMRVIVQNGSTSDADENSSSSAGLKNVAEPPQEGKNFLNPRKL